MLFVRRDGNGNVDGTARALQDGWTGEQLAESHPDIVTWQTSIVPTPAERVMRGIKASPALDAIMQKLAEMDGKTEQQLMADLTGRGRATR